MKERSEKKGAQDEAQNRAGASETLAGVNVRTDESQDKGGAPCVKKSGAAVDERKLALLVGVRRRHIVRWRQTFGARNEDWATVGGVVGLTAAGAKKALQALGLVVDVERATREAVLENGPGVSVRVFKFPTNTRLVLAQRIDRSEMVSVRVRDSAAFRIGDEFEAFDNGAGQLEQRGVWPDAGW